MRRHPPPTIRASPSTAPSCARLAAAMALLTTVQREVLVLHDVEGWKHEEIAAHIGVSAVTSRTHLFKARRRLRVALGADILASVA